MFFDGFALDHVDVGSAVLRVRHGGSGPAVLLLHGHPRTHTTWWRVAPLLVDAGFSVVCPDLRGYGESRPVERVFSKRAIAVRPAAADGAARVRRVRGRRPRPRLLRRAPARGRLPERVTRLVVMDGVPISEAFARCDARFAASWWHWFFFAQTAKPAEAIISRDPLAWYQVDPASMGAGEPRRLGARGVRTRTSSRRWSATTAPGWRSTASTRRPTAPPAGSCAARRCSRGRPATTWRSSTATRWRSGGRGSTRRSAPPGSTPATTWPRRRPEQLASELAEFLSA